MKSFPFFVILLSLAAWTLEAAEIRFKSTPISCRGTLVLLGDVADIVTDGITGGEDDAEKLRNIVLTTSPADGEEKTVRAVEFRTILSRSGVSSLEHRIGGAQKVVLIGASTALVPSKRDRSNSIVQVSATLPGRSNETPGSVVNAAVNTTVNAAEANPVDDGRLKAVITPRLIETLQSQLADAIGVYLDASVSNTPASGSERHRTNSTRKITVTLNAEQARLLATGEQIEEIYGGLAPYTGRQKFDIEMRRIDPRTRQPILVSVEADIAIQSRVLAVRRALPRGHVIGESDVVLTGIDTVRGDEFYTDPNEVIGMETTASIRERDVLQPKMLKRPTWVRQGDVVTVRSGNNGILVRVNGIAQNDGTQGDMIQVARMDPTAKNRRSKNNSQLETFSARVSQPKTVEVFAAPVGVGY